MSEIERIKNTVYPDAAQKDINILLETIGELVFEFVTRHDEAARAYYLGEACRVKPPTPPLADETFYVAMAALEEM